MFYCVYAREAMPGKQNEAKRNALDRAERTSNTGSPWPSWPVSPEHTATLAKQILEIESTFASRNSQF